MLKFRGNLHYLNVPLADEFSKKMVTYANVLRFEFVIGFCASCTGILIVFKTGNYGITLPGNIKRQTIAIVLELVSPTKFPTQLKI